MINLAVISNVLKIKQFALFILLLLLSAPYSLKAEHLVGGEMSYTCLGNNEYRVTLKIYRDCFSTGADFDLYPTMTVFNGSSIFLNTSGSGFESFDMPVVATGPCYVESPNLCVEMGVYEQVISLPPSPLGYTIVHQRCCRGPSILNLNQPASQGNTYFIEIPPMDVDCNSSAEFVQMPPAAICTNEPLAFDHSAIEPDGDELVYSLCTPYHGGTQLFPAPNPTTAPPFQPVAWAPGFSATDPIISDTPFTIDPVTGLLEGAPTQQGQYVIGICVSEYRDGVLLSTTRRDFQINVVPCTQVLSAALGVAPENEDPCSGLDYTFTNGSQNADAFFWDFGVVDDSTAVSTAFAPQYTYPDTGIYNVTLIANPGEMCADTAYMEVVVQNPFYLQIDSAGFTCNDGQLWGFQSSGDFNPATINLEWDFGQGAVPETSSEQNPQGITYAAGGEKTVILTGTHYGCSDDATVNISVPPIITAGILPQTEFCEGLTINLLNDSENGQQYEWHFDDPALPNAVLYSTNAVHTFSAPGVYNVMLVAKANGACADTAYSEIQAYPLLDPHFDTPDVVCFDGHSFNVEVGGVYSDDADILWDFGEEANYTTSTAVNPPPIIYSTTGAYTITLTVSQDGCSETVSRVVQVHPNPKAQFSAVVLEGCAPLTVAFTDESVAGTHLSHHWDFGDGETSQNAFPVHVYSQPGVYTVGLQVATVTGCVGESEQIRPFYITVYEVPQAGFSFDPLWVDIFSPEASVINTSEGAEECVYTLPDGTEITDCDFDYFYGDAGTHQVIQVVTNEDGCQHSVTHSIEVRGHVFYAPNAFSPNEDGINDLFKPVMLGVVDYELQIFNRTGEVVFSTTNPILGWNGAAFNGDYYLTSDTFVYKARVTDTQGFNHDYQGHVSIVR